MLSLLTAQAGVFSKATWLSTNRTFWPSFWWLRVLPFLICFLLAPGLKADQSSLVLASFLPVLIHGFRSATTAIPGRFDTVRE